MRKILYKKIIYPTIFYLNGLDVFNRMEEYKKNDYISTGEMRKFQDRKLAKLLLVAKKEVAFYRNLVNHNKTLNNSESCLSLFKSLPLIRKETVKRQYRLLINNEVNSFMVRKTAGTTGEPIKTFIDKDCFVSQLAARYRFYSWHGIDIGEREARFWGRKDSKNLISFKNILLNRKIFQFQGEIDKECLIEANKLLSYKPDYFYGYSSLILKAAKVWQFNNLPSLTLKAIICTAESLNPIQKKMIEDVFKAPVVMEYGCSEVDIIAFQCKEGRYHVAVENVLIEKKESDLKNGNILVTDLNNKKMCLLKYNLGDIVFFDNKICNCGRTLPVIESIYGRSNDQLVELPKNRNIHSVVFSHIFEELNRRGLRVLQFKVVHVKIDKIIVFVESLDMTPATNITQLVSSAFKQRLGSDVSVEIKIGRIDPKIGSKFSYYEKLFSK